MVYVFRSLVAAVLFFSAQPIHAEAAFSISDYVVELDEVVEGSALNVYANEWWKWAYSMQQSQSPVRDQSGLYCGVNQLGPIWYLAGGFGSSKIQRACTLPADKHIFFPVINMLVYPPPGSTLTCEQAKGAAAENNNDFVYIRVSINGSELENAERFRLASNECFNVYERIPKEYEAPLAAPSATDGYWVMLKPLPPGRYNLEFRAFYTKTDSEYGDMVQNISYDLTVLAN